jgi:hypothetical protein
MEPNPFEDRIRRLEHIVECLMVVREGIQELDGIHTDVYNQADRSLFHRTNRVRESWKRKQEKLEIEGQIEVLKSRLEQYE